jgi:hypothetical protein
MNVAAKGEGGRVKRQLNCVETGKLTKQTHPSAQQRMLHQILLTIALSLSAGWTFVPFRMNKQVKKKGQTS